MNDALNTSGGKTDFPIDPKEVPAVFKEMIDMPEKGTIEFPNEPLIGMHLIEDMKDGMVTRTDFDSWTREPWKAYDTLAGRMNLPEGPERELMYQLQAWHAAGDAFKDNPERKTAALALWKEHHPQEAQHITFAVSRLHERLTQELELAEVNKQSREKEAKGNILENAVTGTWEYLRDWQDHKTMTAALLFAGYMLYKNLKGRRITNYLGIAVAVGAVGVFLREKFGIKPAEALAKGADSVGMNKLGDFVRETRDTIVRPFAGPEDKSENAFMIESLNITGENEQAMFRAFSAENPREYFEWYDAAKQWSLEKSGTPPPLPQKMAGEIANMQSRGILPPTFDSMDRAQQTYLTLQLSDTFFDRIGQYSGQKGSEETKRGGAIAYIREKYVTGEYFDRMYNEWLTEWKKEYGEETGAYARLSDRAKEVSDILREKVRNGSEIVTFAGVLRLEMPDEEQMKLEAFNGPGKSLSDLYSMTKTGFGNGMDLAVNATRRSYEYVTIDVPYAAGKLWDDFVVQNVEKIGMDKNQFVAWTEGFVEGLKGGLWNVKDVIADQSKKIVDSAILPVLGAMGIGIGYGIEKVKDAYVLTSEGAEKLYDKLVELGQSSENKDTMKDAIEMPTPAEEPELEMPTPAEEPELEMPTPTEKHIPSDTLNPEMPTPDPSHSPDMPTPTSVHNPEDIRPQDTTRAQP